MTAPPSVGPRWNWSPSPTRLPTPTGSPPSPPIRALSNPNLGKPKRFSTNGRPNTSSSAR